MKRPRRKNSSAKKTSKKRDENLKRKKVTRLVIVKASRQTNSEEEMKLGDRMKDRISGFEGIAVAYSCWLNGCERFCLQPPTDKNGKLLEAEWVDVSQLRVVKREAFKIPKQKGLGGPQHSATITHRGNHDSRGISRLLS